MKLPRIAVILWASLTSLLLTARAVCGADWPMLGRDGTRNAVSLETGAPGIWCVEERADDGHLIRSPRGIRWSGPLGLQTFSSPVVASGLVWIGTNNWREGVKPGEEYHPVLKCFSVATGKQVYELVSPLMGGRHDIRDAGMTGLGSSPLIEGDRLWLTTNRSEVLCLDIGPLIRGEGMPRRLWSLDLVKEFDISPRAVLMGPPRPCSIGPSWKGRIFVTTNNGVGEDRVQIPKPDAPSVVCLNKDTGKVLWKDNSPGSNILVTQFSSPTVAEIHGQMQVIVPESDGWVRAFDPETGKLLWEFDINAKSSVYDLDRSDRNYFLANAVVYEDRVYIGSGREAENGYGSGRLVCIDPTKRGDVSAELAVDSAGKLLPRRRLQAVNSQAGEKAIPNPNSALVWEFVRCGKQIQDVMHRTMNSVAVAKGLVIAPDFSGVVHCLDAKTGKRYWSHDVMSAIYASPLIVDDKVYVADEDADMFVFRLGADPKQAEPIATVAHTNGIYSSPVYADGTLYVADGRALSAVGAIEARRWHEQAGNWPQWRGPQRDNRSRDTGLLAKWPADGPPLAWRVEGLGDGIASLALADGRIFTTSTYGDSEYAVTLDEGTGESLWATRVGPAVQESPLMRWLSQRTQTVDGNRVYVYTNSGWLVCLETTSGSEIWRISYPHEFGTPRGKWGFCDRPLVDGDKLICTAGGSKATLAALDKRTGKVIWSKLLENREAAGYAASLLVETSGLKQYVVFLDKGIASFAADDGRLLWRYDRVSSFTGNSYTPLVLDDGLLCPNGYGGGLARLKLTRRTNQVFTEEQYFQRQSFNPFEDSTALVDGHFFAFDRMGLSLCIDASDGKSLWGRVRGSGSGLEGRTYADGHMYVRSADGTVALVEANPKEYVEKSHFNLPDPRKSTGATFPVVTGGRLYVRDNDRLYCYDVLQHPPATVPPKQNVVQLTPPKEDSQKPRPPGERVANAIFVPTPQDVVEQMLSVAQVGKDDIVYDLGSGDGRIVIEAAKKYGCRSVGLEIDRDLVKLSQERAREAKLDKLVTIKEADLFVSDFSDATVIAVYLYPDLLKRLLPKFAQVKPGTRIVSHQFEIPDQRPDKTITVDSKETGAKHTVYLWTTPLKK